MHVVVVLHLQGQFLPLLPHTLSSHYCSSLYPCVRNVYNVTGTQGGNSASRAKVSQWQNVGTRLKVSQPQEHER